MCALWGKKLWVLWKTIGFVGAVEINSIHNKTIYTVRPIIIIGQPGSGCGGNYNLHYNL